MDALCPPSDPRGRHPMLDEALDLVDRARADGVQLRLVGGLAVLAQCGDPAHCRRGHRDMDLVGLRRQTKALLVTLARAGYEENVHVRLASGGALLQAFRPCPHVAGGRRLHDDDRVDVYLDTFRLHHELPLRRRLELERYTVPAGDVLLAKLLRTRISETDVRDVIGLLKDADLAEEEAPGVIGLRYVGRAGARDWGLHHDVSANLGRVGAALAGAGLDEAEEARVREALAALKTALGRVRKGPRWRLRALIGERLPWYDAVDENEGARIALRERPAPPAPGGAAQAGSA